MFFSLMDAMAEAGDTPFDMSANWGGTGLMEIPTARILPDGAMRLGLAQASPYTWYSFGFGVLPGLEFSARYTDIANIQTDLGPDYGSYKDKAFDIKYQVVPESKHVPALAIGWNDFQGTQVFESQYVAISRQLYPLDITLGVGRLRLKGPLSICDEIGVWGGMEWAVTDRMHLMLEYNPVEYQQDPIGIQGVPRGSTVPFNLGIRYRTWLGCDLGLSYQRGDTIGLAAHLQFGLGNPILPPKPDPPSWRFVGTGPDSSEDQEKRVSRLRKAIEAAGFIDTTVISEQDELTAEFENNRYISDAQAAGRVLRLLIHYASDETVRLTVGLKRRGLRILTVSVGARDARRYLLGDMTTDQFARRLSLNTPGSVKAMPAASAIDIAASARYRGYRWFRSYGVDPVLESFFNDPSGAYQWRFSLKPFATLSLWPGGALHGSYEIPLYSDIESEADVPSDAVRSDSWKYLGGQPTVNRLLFDQMVRLWPMTYARISAGYLERMYAGVSGEVLTFLEEGRWAVGVEGDWVRKREPDEAWELMDQQNHAILGVVYYRYLPLNVTLKAQGGRFLSGDTGGRLEFRRKFDTGAEIGFWYSWTKTDHLTGFNRGYNDQGIFLKLPFATFTQAPTRTMLQYRISPWTRDVGATIDHWQEIYDLTADLTPAYFLETLDRLDD